MKALYKQTYTDRGVVIDKLEMDSLPAAIEEARERIINNVHMNSITLEAAGERITIDCNRERVRAYRKEEAELEII